MTKFNLVFEGGVAKVMVLIGALQEFESQGHEAGRLLGTSAGAITATLLAAGYSADEIYTVATEKVKDENGKLQPRFATFLDEPSFNEAEIKNSFFYKVFDSFDIPLIPTEKEAKNDKALFGLFSLTEEQIAWKLFELMMSSKHFRYIFSFIEKGGLYAGDEFIQWLTEKLDAKGLGQATLAEMCEKTGKDLTVIASNTTRGEMMALNHRTAPDCPVVWAVRMSMSIPFLWQEVHWREEWGLYQGLDIKGSTIVDGGVLSNFPIRLLVSRTTDVTNLMGPRIDSDFTLGLLIDETLPVPNCGERESHSFFDSLPPVIRINQLIDTMTQASDKKVAELYGQGVCRLPAKGYGTTEFDMSDHRLDAIVEAGRLTLRQFLADFSPLPPQLKL
jgi:predicted acylesterase/phospholipase RssA